MILLYLYYRIIKLYNDNPNLPVYEHTNRRYNAEKIVKVLLNPNIPVGRVSTSQPVCVQDNVTLIVDLSKLHTKEDIRADDLGSWHCNGKRFIKCEVDDEGNVIEIVTQARRRAGSLYTLIRRYYEHTTSRDFKKTIAEILGKVVIKSMGVNGMCNTKIQMVCSI